MKTISPSWFTMWAQRSNNPELYSVMTQAYEEAIRVLEDTPVRITSFPQAHDNVGKFIHAFRTAWSILPAPDRTKIRKHWFGAPHQSRFEPELNRSLVEPFTIEICDSPHAHRLHDNQLENPSKYVTYASMSRHGYRMEIWSEAVREMPPDVLIEIIGYELIEVLLISHDYKAPQSQYEKLHRERIIHESMSKRGFNPKRFRRWVNYESFNLHDMYAQRQYAMNSARAN